MSVGGDTREHPPVEEERTLPDPRSLGDAWRETESVGGWGRGIEDPGVADRLDRYRGSHPRATLVRLARIPSAHPAAITPPRVPPPAAGWAPAARPGRCLPPLPSRTGALPRGRRFASRARPRAALPCR